MSQESTEVTYTPAETPAQETVSDTVAALQTEINLHKALLKQIHGMYDNPELKRICQEAMKGNWKTAFYEKYKPDILKKKVKEKEPA